jgi:cytoskeleton protein RodZ
MAAAAGGDLRAGIGSRLRAAREKKSLTILQAAEKMHVDARILESLEAEDFAALGAPVYARGHLRHYAELVGESPTELQKLYADSTQSAPAQPDLTRIARAQPESDSGKLVGPAVIGLAAVGLVGVVWWLLMLSGEKGQPGAVHDKLAGHTTGAVQASPIAADADTEDETPVPVPAPELESTPRDAKSGVGAGARAGASTSATAATQPNSKAAAATKSGSSTAAKVAAATSAASSAPGKVLAATNAMASAAAKTPATKTPASATASAPGAAAPVAVANVAAPPPGPRAKDGELTLKFSSDSWAEVYDASGQRLFYDVGAAASAHTVRGQAPLRVILGNASGVAVEYNGRPAMIPVGVQRDGSTRFVINAHGRTVPAGPASDGD